MCELTFEEFFRVQREERKLKEASKVLDLKEKSSADRTRKFFLKQRAVMSLMDLALKHLEDLGSPNSKNDEESTFENIDWRNLDEVTDFFADLGLELKFSVVQAGKSLAGETRG